MIPQKSYCSAVRIRITYLEVLLRPCKKRLSFHRSGERFPLVESHLPLFSVFSGQMGYRRGGSVGLLNCSRDLVPQIDPFVCFLWNSPDIVASQKLWGFSCTG